MLLVVIIASYLGVFSFNYWSQILANKKEKSQLEAEYTKLLEDEENLKSQINKLQDPEYVAEYAREKYMLSKDGEIIIKVEDIDK
jgi:cell division protein FtsL